jgi:hypothetical protein
MSISGRSYPARPHRSQVAQQRRGTLDELSWPKAEDAMSQEQSRQKGWQ